jgi:nucleotide-binding universal stress UspA family protein
MLLPVQPGDCSLVAAKILDTAWPSSGDVTLLAVDSDGARAASAVAEVITRRPVEADTLDAEDPVEAVVQHLRLGYDVIGIGAWHDRGNERLLSPLSEALLARATVPSVVVWDSSSGKLEAARGFRRILVPVVSTVASRAAQEVAFSLAAASGAEVVITHIDVERTAPVPASAVATGPLRQEGSRSRVRQGVAHGVVYEAADLARRLGAEPHTEVRQSTSRAEAISELTTELDIDLLVLGSELQPVAGETFLGHLVERLIRAVDCSVAVVAMPRAALGMAHEAYPSS